MKIHRKYLPQDIINKYDLEKKFHNDYAYVRIKKGMYGLKQAAVLAYDNLVKILAPFGYRPIPHTTGLWKHDTKPISFCLCVDDFGMKYFDKKDVDHLISALQSNYVISTDWTQNNSDLSGRMLQTKFA